MFISFHKYPGIIDMVIFSTILFMLWTPKAYKIQKPICTYKYLLMENIWEKGYRGVGKKKILSNGETSPWEKVQNPVACLHHRCFNA